MFCDFCQTQQLWHLYCFAILGSTSSVIPWTYRVYRVHGSTQREPTPTQKSARKWQVRPFATSCAKHYKGHSLVQSSFAKLPNSSWIYPPLSPALDQTRTSRATEGVYLRIAMIHNDVLPVSIDLCMFFALFLLWQYTHVVCEAYHVQNRWCAMQTTFVYYYSVTHFSI